ncbi:hypothetical protein [Paracoccus cavernae]|uniref:hypothetical protein n=1 Tax=Paracoccus cavernae TaxID=1571207 RepID=UPI0035F446D0
MKTTKLCLTAVGLLALGALPGFAQDAAPADGGLSFGQSGWEFEAAAYLWLPESKTGVSTPYGRAVTSLSAGDAVDALDVGVMFAVNARQGDWALVGDVFYLDLTLQDSSPLGLFYSGGEARTRLTSIAGYGLYNFYEDDKLRVEAGGGLRYMSSEIDVTLHGNLAADRKTSISDDWIDPVIAFRTTAKLGERLDGVLWLDGGGFDLGGSTSDRSWQVSAMLHWKANEKWTIGGGYRTLYVDRENDGTSYDLRMSGPILGASMRF